MAEQRYDEVDRLRELNALLLDNLQATVMWIAQFSERTGTKVPNLDSLIRLMKEGRKILNEMVTPAPRIIASEIATQEIIRPRTQSPMPIQTRRDDKLTEP